MPKLKMMDGTSIPLDEEKAKRVSADLMGGAKWLKVSGALINASSVSGVYPDVLTRGQLTAGRLHDGTQVIKNFGHWMLAHNPDVRIDPKYYPEVFKDTVLSDAEWEMEIKPLKTVEERKARYLAIVDGRSQKALPEGRQEENR